MHLENYTLNIKKNQGRIFWSLHLLRGVNAKEMQAVLDDPACGLGHRDLVWRLWIFLVDDFSYGLPAVEFSGHFD